MDSLEALQDSIDALGTPPPVVTGVTASTGGGSGEVQVSELDATPTDLDPSVDWSWGPIDAVPTYASRVHFLFDATDPTGAVLVEGDDGAEALRPLARGIHGWTVARAANLAPGLQIVPREDP